MHAQILISLSVRIGASRRQLFGLLALALALSLGAAYADAAAQPRGSETRPQYTPFVQCVLEHFDAWDTGKTDTLTVGEIDRLMIDSRVTGDAAAALASIKWAVRRLQRDGKPVPTLNREHFQDYNRAFLAGAKGLPAYDTHFRDFQARLAGFKQDLLPDPPPTIDTIHMGTLADSSFLAALAGLLSRQQDALQHMVEVNPEGGFWVTFAARGRIQSRCPTDAERVLQARSLDDSLCIPLIEGAFATVVNSDLPAEKRLEEKLDTIDHGATLGAPLRLLSGHEATDLRELLDPKEPAETALPKLRGKLAEALAQHRLVTASIPKISVPPGLPTSFAYAVLGLDPNSDTVRLWCPSGQDFHPRGDAGTKNGYSISHGRLEMSLADFRTCFRDLCIETNTGIAAKPAADSSARSSPFADCVLAHFDAWDADHDGVLSSTEIDRLVVDSRIKADVAVAVAVLREFVRGLELEKKPLPTLTRDHFVQHARTVQAGKKAEQPYESRYRAFQAKLASCGRELLPHPLPTIDTIHQGRMGDCYFVASLGAMINRNHDAIGTMIELNPQGGLRITFAGHRQPIHSPMPTDTELLLQSFTDDGALCIPALEGAFATLMSTLNSSASKSPEKLDIIDHGGQMALGLRLVTGHDAVNIAWNAKKRDDAHVRSTLVRALAEHRLVAAGTPGSDPTSSLKPPGIVFHHAYAVIGFDEKKEIIRIWNPHGRDFHPKGPPGLANGYPTSHGRFEMPFDDFCAVYTSLCTETTKPWSTTPAK